MAQKRASNRVSSSWAPTYADFTEEIRVNFSRKVPRKSAPNLLYHFTDCDGLIGILRDKTIWASLATSLNDRSETQHALSIIRDLIDRNEVHTKWLPLDRLLSNLEQPQSWRHYVVSLCGQSGTALHWLHYGRSGSGVAIGFDTRALRRDAKGFQFRLYPVLYREERQRAWLKSVVRTVDAIFGRKLKKLERAIDRELLHDVALDLVANEFWTIAPRLKASVFAPELEWRLVASIPMGGIGFPSVADPTGTTHFRTSFSRVVPFKKLTFEVLPAVEIVLGSSAPLRQDLLALQVLMEGTLGTGIKISDSPVPVRQ